MFKPGNVVTVNFPGVTGVKRRPAVVLSSAIYHATRPDVIVGLITTQTIALGSTDYALQDWEAAGLLVASVFRSFIVTLPKLGKRPDKRRTTLPLDSLRPCDSAAALGCTGS